MREHVTDGKPCWCGPKALKEGEAVIWVHRSLPPCPICDDTLADARRAVIEAAKQKYRSLVYTSGVSAEFADAELVKAVEALNVRERKP